MHLEDNVRVTSNEMARKSGTKTAKANGGKLPILPVRDAVHFPNLINTLLVGRNVSLRALHHALNTDRLVIILTQRDTSVEEPGPSDLFKIGVLSEVVQVLPLPDGTMRVVVRGLERTRVGDISFRDGFMVSAGKPIEQDKLSGPEVDAMIREGLRMFEEVMQIGKQVPVEALQMASHLEDPGQFSDAVAHSLPLRPSQKQEVLEEISPTERLKLVIKLLDREREVLRLQQDIRQSVEEELGESQREYFLREQLKVIQRELNERDERSSELDEYREKIENAGMSQEVREKADHELRRLERAPSASPESMVIRSYLDWLTSLPWQQLSDDQLDVRKAKKILDRDHHGLEKVKDRILDFLAVRQLSRSLRGPILCFVGPPGVGKTSIGRSIAESLGRQFVRVSLGGVRDEAEIRGHRRTYIGSMPGRIIQGLRNCGTRNPVFMLDEIDKLGMDFRGDPTSALLETLDPEQNNRFSDHYIDAPFDLSAVMFITTANLIESIPWPLRDRMEAIHFPSYTEIEKVAIAKDHLLPKKTLEHGLKNTQLKVSEKILFTVVREYTREAGVRNLEREISAVCRKTARKVAEGKAKGVTVTEPVLREFLGQGRYQHGVKESSNSVGTATGLVYTEFGGDVVTIEVIQTPAEQAEPEIILTGQLGDVMKESAQAAITCVRDWLSKSNPSLRQQKHNLHIHVPAGAVPKDGPSAGITIATAYASAITGKPVKANVAMTGEITLRGKVLPIGGLREKLLSAHRAGISDVIIPAESKRDLAEVPKQVLTGLRVHTVSTLPQVLSLALVDASPRGPQKK